MRRFDSAGRLIALTLGAVLITSMANAAGFQEDYDRAYQALESARQPEDVKAAALMFEALTERADGGKLLPNTWYWMGEAYYDLKEYQKALYCFERTLTWPNSYKEEPARFKVAMCYVRLGWTAEARWELERFIKDYPSSSLAPVVKSELAKLPR